MTPSGNVEVVRRTFESYSRGDYDDAASCLDPDVVWEVAQEMPALGRAAVRAMWERWDSAWEEMETIPEDFLEAGDHVVVTVHYKARGRGSGIVYDERLHDVYTMRDGLCVRKVEFRTREEALRAAGIAPWVASDLVSALRASDRGALADLLSEDVAFHSPVTDYRGRDEVVHLLATIGTVIEDIRIRRELSRGAETVTLLEGTVGEKQIEGVLDQIHDEAGSVTDLTLMLRPLDALIAAVKRMGAALGADRPGPAA